MKLPSFSTRRMEKESFFEGPEKRLEIHFCTLNSSSATLLDIHLDKWKEVLRSCKCNILSSIENKWCQAHLLSESSLFIWEDKLLLKTCGQIDIFQSVEAIMKLTQELKQVQPILVLYSHRKFIRPELQPTTYQSLDKESKVWNQLVSEWNLEYSNLDDSNSSSSSFQEEGDYVVFIWRNNIGIRWSTTSVPFYKEVTSFDLPSALLETFEEKNHLHFVAICQELFNGGKVLVDPHWFSPQGYSVNILIQEKEYITIHLTPQTKCSYISVESNLTLDQFKIFLSKMNYPLHSTTIIYTPNGIK